jgi:predicted regulator of Ras-like GTPase activity (Roadblock/LC7/MglB family)
MDAAEALADLKQISTQVDRAVIVGADGAVEASSDADADVARRIAQAGTGLYAAADRVRAELGRPRLTQLEVSTPEGSVFAVREGLRTIVATTSVGPTVGLIFYDLKTCLRNVAEHEDGPLDPAAATVVEPQPPAPPATGAVPVAPAPGWAEVPAHPRPGVEPAHGAAGGPFPTAVEGDVDGRA